MSTQAVLAAMFSTLIEVQHLRCCHGCLPIFDKCWQPGCSLSQKENGAQVLLMWPYGVAAHGGKGLGSVTTHPLELPPSLQSPASGMIRCYAAVAC